MSSWWKWKQGYSCKNPSYFYGTTRVLSNPGYQIKSNLATTWTIKCHHTICSRIEITLPYSLLLLLLLLFSLLLRYWCALLSTMMASEGYFQLVRSKHNAYHETKFYTSKSGPIKSRTNVIKKKRYKSRMKKSQLSSISNSSIIVARSKKTNTHFISLFHTLAKSVHN